MARSDACGQGVQRLRVLPPVKRGDLLLLRDGDYIFGEGPLVLRVLAVYEVREFRNELWVFLRGLEVRTNGGGGRQRNVLVSGSALRERRRTPGMTAFRGMSL